METPLRGRLGGHTGNCPYHSNAHRHSEKVEIKILMLAVTLQRKSIVLAPSGDDKTAKVSFPRRAVTIKRQKYRSRAAR